MTSEDFQRYARITVYFIGGNLVQRGLLTDGSVTLIAGVAAVGANFVWTVWGNRIAAKLAELGKLAKDPNTPVAGVVVENTPEGKALAKSTPGVVVAGTVAAANVAATP